MSRTTAAQGWQECFRTTEAPVFPPSPGWFERMRAWL
jgi:hypothetical protein